MIPGFHRFAVGSFECTSLCDGEHDYPISEIFMEPPEAEARSALRARGLRDDLVITPYTYLHIDTGTRQILVDAGAGTLGPTTGGLVENMREAEIAPESIDTLIITHAHPDHIGGLLRADGSPTFANASYIMWRREWDYWHSDVQRMRANTRQRFFFDFARTILDPMREGVRLIDLDSEPFKLLPGVCLLPAPGHTPGQIAVLVTSGAESVMYTADAVISPIHLEHITWTPVFDIDPRAASETKRRIFDLAVELGALVLGQHFPPFPSLGRVSRLGAVWEWQPITVTV